MAAAAKSDKPHSPAAILTAVDKWYRRHARALPWRTPPAEADVGVRPDPYRVWLSEIMLQQTTVPHAAPYFLKFVERWPQVGDLAAASWDEVSAAWAGLGYYSRARNLHACAKAVAARGSFPHDRDGLLELPGVGPYTASAVAAIAFGQKTAPVDGNIERVVSRLHTIGSDRTEAGWRKAKGVIASVAEDMFQRMPARLRPGDIAQGLMDLGATICTPRKPACAICPLSAMCRARASGEPGTWPMKPEKSDRPARFGSAFIALRGNEVLLVRRPDAGLLGGMLMPPTGPWSEAAGDPLEGQPAKLAWERIGEVRHVFTHFSLKLGVFRAEAGPRTKIAGEWLAHDAALAALPTVGRKAVKLALSVQTPAGR
jgi:A/G-specific adenine glycosylase